jgi:hypothetical protein
MIKLSNKENLHCIFETVNCQISQTRHLINNFSKKKYLFFKS